MPSSNPISYGQGKLSTKITSNSINPTHSSGTLISSTPKKYERTPIKPLIDVEQPTSFHAKLFSTVTSPIRLFMQKNNYDSFTSIENDDKLTCPKLDLVDTNDNSTDSNSTSYQDENIIVQEVTTKRSSFFTIFSPAYRVFNYFSRHPLNTLLEVDKSGEDSFTDTTIIEDQATVNGEQIQIHDGEGKVLDVVANVQQNVNYEDHEEDNGQYSTEYYEDELDTYSFIRALPPISKEQLWRAAALPPKLRSSPPITLVLDLDETLVHCSTSPLSSHDIMFPVTFNNQVYQVTGRYRPHYLSFLQRVSQLFEVVVFTASQEAYADHLLDLMDPKRALIKYRLFRNSCYFIGGNYLKDLNILGRDLSKIIIIDNSPQAFGYHIPNGIPITSWYDDPTDTELIKVLSFLESIVDVDDVRPAINEQYRFYEAVYGHQYTQ